MGTKGPPGGRHLGKSEGDTWGKARSPGEEPLAHSFQSILWAFSPLFILNYLIYQDYLLRIFHPQGYVYEITVLPSVL